MIPLINHDSSEGEQWSRYNLPRYTYIYIYIYIYSYIYIPSIFLFIYIYNTTRKIDNIKIHYDPSFVAPDLCGATELLQCRLGLLDARVVHLARRHGGTFAMGEMAGFTMENPGKKNNDL